MRSGKTNPTMNEEPEYGVLGLPEHELRTRLEEELVRSMRAEGEVPTIHAIAHSIARVFEQDHERMAQQLGQAGIRLGG